MTSLVDIANRALQELGSRTTVASLTEGSNEAIQCNIAILPVIDELLTAYHWNWSRRTVTLALWKAAPGTPENASAVATVWSPAYPPPPWRYSYMYPSDCIQGQFIVPQPPLNASGGIPIFPSTPFAPYGALADLTARAVRFVVAADVNENGVPITVILTDQSQAILVYTARIEDPTQWSSPFIQLVVLSLAERICMPITGDKQLKLGIEQRLEVATRFAATADGNEGLTIQEIIPDTLVVRGYGERGPNAGGRFS